MDQIFPRPYVIALIFPPTVEAIILEQIFTLPSTKKKTKKIKLFTSHKERVFPRFTIQMLFKATPSFHLYRA